MYIFILDVNFCNLQVAWYWFSVAYLELFWLVYQTAAHLNEEPADISLFLDHPVVNSYFRYQSIRSTRAVSSIHTALGLHVSRQLSYYDRPDYKTQKSDSKVCM